MIVVGIILIIMSIIALYYSNKFDKLSSTILFIAFVLAMFFGIGFTKTGIANLKSKEKEIKNVKSYNVKSTIIIEDNIPTDTIYTIYYKKK